MLCVSYLDGSAIYTKFIHLCGVNNDQKKKTKHNLLVFRLNVEPCPFYHAMFFCLVMFVYCVRFRQSNRSHFLSIIFSDRSAGFCLPFSFNFSCCYFYLLCFPFILLYSLYYLHYGFPVSFLLSLLVVGRFFSIFRFI